MWRLLWVVTHCSAAVALEAWALGVWDGNQFWVAPGVSPLLFSDLWVFFKLNLLR